MSAGPSLHLCVQVFFRRYFQNSTFCDQIYFQNNSTFRDQKKIQFLKKNFFVILLFLQKNIRMKTLCVCVCVCVCVPVFELEDHSVKQGKWFLWVFMENFLCVLVGTLSLQRHLHSVFRASHWNPKRSCLLLRMEAAFAACIRGFLSTVHCFLSETDRIIVCF